MLYTFHIHACNAKHNLYSENGGSGQQCCYNDIGFLLPGSAGGGTVDLVAPEESISRHFEMDVKPYIYCCKGIFSDCDAYYRKRPSSDGTGYELPIPGKFKVVYTHNAPSVLLLSTLLTINKNM